MICLCFIRSCFFTRLLLSSLPSPPPLLPPSPPSSPPSLPPPPSAGAGGRPEDNPRTVRTECSAGAGNAKKVRQKEEHSKTLQGFYLVLSLLFFPFLLPFHIHPPPPPHTHTPTHTHSSEEKAVILATLEQKRSSGGQQGPVTVLSPPRITEEEMYAHYNIVDHYSCADSIHKHA